MVAVTESMNCFSCESRRLASSTRRLAASRPVRNLTSPWRRKRGLLRQDFESCMLEWTFWPRRVLLEADTDTDADLVAEADLDDNSLLGVGVSAGPKLVLVREEAEAEAEDAHIVDAHPEADLSL
jgi:hypothetical protein